MKKNFLFALLVTGLSVSAQTDTTAPSKKTSPRIATVHTLDGKKLKGWLYSMDENNIYLLSTKTKQVQLKDYKALDLTSGRFSINVSQINTISTQKKNGGLKGALIGLGVGAAAGAIMGFASGDDPMKPYTGEPISDFFIALANSFALTAEEKAAGGAVTGALTGALTGFIIGKLAKKKFIIGGKKDNYRDLQGELMKRLIIK